CLEDNKCYEDWINRLSGYMHLIQPARPCFDPPIKVYSILETTIPLTDSLNTDTDPKITEIHFAKGEKPRKVDTNNSDLTYDDVPRSEAAIASNLRVDHVRKFLDDLVRPDNLSDPDYKKFINYATNFFRDSNRLETPMVHTN
ncbi:hypothetical protein H0H93_016053, partial [Arthromyces matolae]